MREEITPAILFKKCKQALLALKGEQPVGADSIALQVTRGTKSYTLPANGTLYAIITFTADTQANALADLTWENNMYIDCTKRRTEPGSKVTQFELYLTNYTFSTVTYSLNLEVISTDSGVIS